MRNNKFKPRITVVIPARYASTRFEGKPLAKILGKPLIYYVYSRAKKSLLTDDIVVATDDERIKRCVEGFGGKVIMTKTTHQTGTDRIAEAAQKIDSDIIVNAQGDEPLLHSGMISEVSEPLIKDSSIKVVTLVNRLTDAADFIDTTNVKAVIDLQGNIIFMSRSPIPYPKTRQSYCVYKQVGMYAFRRDYLIAFSKMKPTPLELVEGIELLRVIENGQKLKAVVTEHRTFSVDTVSDLCEVTKIIKDAKAKHKEDV